MYRNRGAFTLIELLVVVLIIGILSAIAIPSYIKALENSKADDAAAVVKMIGTTNRMFQLDNNVYAGGQITSLCVPSDAAHPCDTSGAPTGCMLVTCRYLSSQNYSSKPYSFYACTGPAGGGNGCCAAGYVSCGSRNAGGPAYSTNFVYAMNTNGQITAIGNAPTPP